MRVCAHCHRPSDRKVGLIPDIDLELVLRESRGLDEIDRLAIMSNVLWLKDVR
jgi:hypothetical protein